MTTSTKRSRSAVSSLLCCFRDGSATHDEEKATAAKPTEAESESKGDPTTTTTTKEEEPKPAGPDVTPAEPAASSGTEAAKPKEFAHQYAVSFPSSFTDPWDVYELLDDKLGEGKYALRQETDRIILLTEEKLSDDLIKQVHALAGKRIY